MTRWKKGSEVGTIISKAPEVLINNEYGYRSDLWAIGILFYEMITGIPPFWFKYGLSN
jgi:serine/threonine protein kinase